MSVLRMTDLDMRGKRVLIREDLNVPVKEGRITSEQRIKAALPTLRLATGPAPDGRPRGRGAAGRPPACAACAAKPG